MSSYLLWKNVVCYIFTWHFEGKYLLRRVYNDLTEWQTVKARIKVLLEELCFFRKTLDLSLHCSIIITNTCLYNFDPLKPHFYIVKLRFTGVYIIFLISAQKHRLWVFVRTAIYVLSRNMKKKSEFIIWKFKLFGWNFLYIWIGMFS